MSSDTNPNPSDVEPLGDSEGLYDIDSDGELKPLPATVIEYDGKQREVRFYPIPPAELDDYQQLGENLEMESLADILAKKVHTPNRTKEEWAERTPPRQFMAVLNELVLMATGDEPSSQIHKEVQEDLEKKGSGSGN